MADAIDSELYKAHLETLTTQMTAALGAQGYEGVLIASGHLHPTFLDDQSYPFRVNPHFNHWLPVTDVENSFVLFRPGERPVLLYYQPRDYWHLPAADPEGFWVDSWDIQPISAVEEAGNRLGDAASLAYIGEDTALAAAWQLGTANDPQLLAALHYDRAVKSGYELACMAAASDMAASGHLAARHAFRNGASEFEILLTYLGAIGHRESATPYQSIIALNEHCAVLHYQHYDRSPPPSAHSFLIDAGASCNGYAADVTRTWAAGPGLFADLVDALDGEQRAIIDEIRVGMNYADLHARMHLRLAGLLQRTGIVAMTPESMVEAGVTGCFLPHGLGHLLGLQTHDIGGFQQNPAGDTAPAPAEYPALRLTRDITEGQVFTIEPGLYFIPMLLEELAAGPHARLIDFALIDELRPAGGIRIEDNIAIVNGTPVNLTRKAFAKSEDNTHG